MPRSSRNGWRRSATPRAEATSARPGPRAGGSGRGSGQAPRSSWSGSPAWSRDHGWPRGARGWGSRDRPRSGAASRAGGPAGPRPRAARRLALAWARRRPLARPRASARVGERVRLGAAAAPGTARGVSPSVLLQRRVPPSAPAAFRCARMTAPSRKASPGSGRRRSSRASRCGRSRTPGRDQRVEVRAAIRHDRRRRSPVPQGGSRLAAPEGAELGRDGAPLGPVPRPPGDRLDGAA